MRFSKQGYWSGLPFPSPGDLPDPGIHQLRSTRLTEVISPLQLPAPSTHSPPHPLRPNPRAFVLLPLTLQDAFPAHLPTENSNVPQPSRPSSNLLSPAPGRVWQRQAFEQEVLSPSQKANSLNTLSPPPPGLRTLSILDLTHVAGWKELLS